jgi:hypothetical protein
MSFRRAIAARIGAQTGQTCRNRCYNVAAASFADPTF